MGVGVGHHAEPWAGLPGSILKETPCMLGDPVRWVVFRRVGEYAGQPRPLKPQVFSPAAENPAAVVIGLLAWVACR